MKLIIDTREQKPFPFARYDAEVEKAALPVGDYSIPGFEDKVSIERKSLDDLIGCLCKDRNRFERELQRGRSFESFAVVIEASLDDVRNGRYRSGMKPHAALQSIIAFQVRYGVSFVWAGSREGAEYWTYFTLQKYLCEIEKRYQAATKGQGVSIDTPAKQRKAA